MPAPTIREETENAGETGRIGTRLAEGLVPGDVVIVSGELGAGKTTLVRGACRALGVEGPVTSPTFEIGHLYAGRVEVAHLDLYRLPSLSGEDPALMDDYLTPERIAFVEWPGQAGGLIENVVARVSIEHLGGDRRRVEVVPA
ncbi:MAG: tRNA threonylcarbamoyladenosine biosynthesis protein TsaE [Thermoleophilaceae bacterium]|jgi:tRNA threonylcarbamoyladenosine biosynthesis protein TsaE|nr:tRNA threonylcarbamoyladenosine biosynthesis protein TsaE [Thermoleophilaceae bacterium]